MDTIRIGTRNSPLALWQAEEVASKLQALGKKTTLVPIVSTGDKNLVQPLYAMDIIGVFTKDLDIALLNDQIDIAVHSLKDVPTCLPKGIYISAVLERDFEQDILIRNPKSNTMSLDNLNLATGSLRRRAFWNAKYPNCTFSNIRGNVQTRLKKLEEENFDGTIFSLAGIKRMNLPVKYEVLDFIIPAPSQGVVAIASLEENAVLNKLISQINHTETEVCTTIERDFLQYMQAGCTAPIGAIAKIKDDEIIFTSSVVSLDGTERIDINKNFPLSEYNSKGKELAKKALDAGAKPLLTR